MDKQSIEFLTNLKQNLDKYAWIVVQDEEEMDIMADTADGIWIIDQHAGQQVYKGDLTQILP